jgi:hypothetical protein
LTAEAARLLVPNLLLGNTILLTNARSCRPQALRIGEIIDAGEHPPGSRRGLGERMAPLLDRRHGLARPAADHGVGPGVTPPRGFRVVRSGSRTGLSTSITARHATGIKGGAAIPVGELHGETERCAVKIDG